MITNIEYSKGPHPSLFQINYVLGNDYLTLLGLKEYCSDVDSTARYIAGIYQTSVVLRNEVISVEVIVDENHINSVRLINTNDTVTTMFPLFEPAMTELAAQIVETQSLEDLTYSEDSKYTSLVLIKAVENALNKAAVSEK